MIKQAREVDVYSILSTQPILRKQPKARKPLSTAFDIIDIVTAFDIETTTLSLPYVGKDINSAVAFMYIWQFQIADITVIGHSWEEALKFFQEIKKACQKIQREQRLDGLPLVICFVHNLSFEHTFLSGVYYFNDDECFFRDARKPLYCRMYDCLEFRCSYIQSGMSLAHFTREMGVEEKLSGEKFDYTKIRYPWTELTDYEIEYCVRDVRSLVECMKVRLQKNGDTLQTIPLTNTGYVRRECKEALQPYYLDIKEMLPNLKQFQLLRKAFRGGNTHCYRKYTTKLLDNVYSYDMSSCYPAQQLTQKFPMRKFKSLDDDLREERILKFIGLGYAVVATYYFVGLRLKTKTTIPYLSFSRTKADQVTLDNGRILEAKYCECTLTEIDLEIVIKQYTWDSMKILTAMTAKKDYLPHGYRRLIIKYYENKTKLKGINDPDTLFRYAHNKSMLNAIFGMSCYNVLSEDVLYNGGDFKKIDFTDDEAEKKLMKAKYPYQWGLYTTAYARKMLQEAIDIAGEQMVYCDTDSIKTKGPVKLDALNYKRKRIAEEFGAYADDSKGVRHYMGVFEFEQKYQKFCSCGAKRYAYYNNECKYAETCPNGKVCGLHLTVSGLTTEINEETGFPKASEELGCIENFTENFVWEHSGGTMAIYNDKDDIQFIEPQSGFPIHITKNVAIVPRTYRMTFAKDYKDLILNMKLYGEYKEERK